MRFVVAGTIAVLVAAAVAVGGAGAQESKPCAYDSHRPAPLTVGKLAPAVVAGRRAAFRVIARGYRGRLFGQKLTRLTIRFERVDNAEETFSASLLKAYRGARPGDNIGYDVEPSDPGERAIVAWTDAGGSEPCTGKARTSDLYVASARRAQRPQISSRSNVTDERHGDSALLRVGGRATGCPLTDPAALTVVATSAGVTKRLRLEMACGRWRSHAALRVDRFTLLAEDGSYIGASRLYVSPRAAPTPGAQLSIAVYKGKRRLATKRFRATQTAAGTRVVAG
jgi:hypothetical protein